MANFVFFKLFHYTYKILLKNCVAITLNFNHNFKCWLVLMTIDIIVLRGITCTHLILFRRMVRTISISNGSITSLNANGHSNNLLGSNPTIGSSLLSKLNDRILPKEKSRGVSWFYSDPNSTPHHRNSICRQWWDWKLLARWM